MSDEAFAVRPRHVRFRRIFGFEAAENGLPISAGGELIGMVDGVTTLVPQEHLAPFRGPSFYFQHLMEFQRLQSRMRQVEWNGDGRHAFRREPLIPKVAVGAPREPTV